MAEYILGIDIGGTNTKFGLVDREGEISHEGSFSTQADLDFPTFLDNLEGHIGGLIKEYAVIGAGVGAPNGNYYKGTIEHAPNLNWGEIVDFKDQFTARFKIPVSLTNDANAAALGEMKFGGARGIKDFVVFTLGTGLGSGIVVDGKLVYGNTGMAGELGHVSVNPEGRYCACGRRGCLETYVSATGIKRTVSKLMADYTRPSVLRDISYNDLDGKAITEAAKNHDFIAIKAFEYTGKILGQKLADTVLHTSPKTIFLFGGLVHAGEYLLDPAKHYMEEKMFKPFKNLVDLRPSSLMDKNAAVLGSAALGWTEFGE
ncbi:MAG: ROK family protein [Reichenbachiella sp.]